MLPKAGGGLLRGEGGGGDILEKLEGGVAGVLQKNVGGWLKLGGILESKSKGWALSWGWLQNLRVGTLISTW